MEKIKHLVFKAKRIDKPEFVKGFLEFVDVLEKEDGQKSLLLVSEDGQRHIIVSETLEHVNKPSPEQPFEEGDRLFVENSDGTASFYQLHYHDDEINSEWILIPFTDKHFNKPLEKEGRVIPEQLSSFTYDMLNRVEDFEFDSL